MLPADPSHYLRGRNRQAVRTNVSHARGADLTVSSYMIDDWAPGPGDIRADHIAPGPIERWMVLAPGGEMVADSILSVDEDVALLHGLVSSVTYARWLLHTAIVERLCGCCSVLLINSEDVYLMGAGNQHFQRLLGYGIARLRLLHPSPGTRVTSVPETDRKRESAAGEGGRPPSSSRQSAPVRA